MYPVSLENVSKTIKGHAILRDVSLQIGEGERIGLTGKNGSGKSMLFKVMTGRLLPDLGNVLIWGKTIARNRTFPQDTGCLMERPGMLPQYSAMKNLELPAGIQGKCTKADIAAYLERFQLDPMDRRPIRKYSLGMKQKLGIIQAMMEKPKLLVLDEPTNNLDEASIAIFYGEIEKLQSEGATTVIASHDRAGIGKLCAKIYRIERGVVDCAG